MNENVAHFNDDMQAIDINIFVNTNFHPKYVYTKFGFFFELMLIHFYVGVY